MVFLSNINIASREDDVHHYIQFASNDSNRTMTTLLDVPNDLLSHILKHLTITDLWRLGLVCRKFYDKDPEKNAVEGEFKESDDVLRLSTCYMTPPESCIMSVFNVRQRVYLFERTSSFAREMTRLARSHGHDRFRRMESGSKYPDLHSKVSSLWNGLRRRKACLFFAQFSRADKLLWQGFLRDSRPFHNYYSAFGVEEGER